MARKPVAREKLIDAFERIVLEDGERAATLDAVAAAAGVSKGGLLYHFPTRQALVEGSLEHLRELAAEDLDYLRGSPQGAAREFVAASWYEDSPLDRCMIVASRLVQAGNEEAKKTFAQIQEDWYGVVLEDVKDPMVATAIKYMGDGLYQQASLGLLPQSSGAVHAQLQLLLDAVERLVSPST